MDLKILVAGGKQPPDAAHPFAHGKELYSWSLISPCSRSVGTLTW